jgi:hypothetical protein
VACNQQFNATEVGDCKSGQRELLVPHAFSAIARFACHNVAFLSCLFKRYHTDATRLSVTPAIDTARLVLLPLALMAWDSPSEGSAPPPKPKDGA